MVSAGNNTNATDVNAIIAATLTKPLCRLAQAVAQSIPDNVGTALTFTTEDIDTHGFHDTASNNSRITPTVAGYYRFFGSYITGIPTTLVVQSVHFRKNGSTAIPPGGRGNEGAVAQARDTTAIVSMNGTTDYVELMATQDSSGAVNTNVAGQFTSVFECEFLRPL